MAEDIELRITARQQGQGLAAVTQDAARLKAELKQVQQVAKVDGRVSMDAREVEATHRQLKLIDDSDLEVRVDVDDSDVEVAEGALKRIDGATPDAKVNVDTSEVRRAEGDIRDLDSIPPPMVEVQVETNADEAIGQLEGALSNVSAGGMVANLAGQLSGALSAAGPVGMAVGAGVGVLAATFGDDLATGIGRALNARRSSLEMQMRTGLSEIDLAPIGAAAGAAFADGFGEELQDLKIGAADLQQTLGNLDGSFNLDKSIRHAETLNRLWGIDIPTSSTNAARLIRQGLARDTEEAYDIMIGAAQRYQDVGVEAIELTREFGSVFGYLGLNGTASVDFIARSYKDGLIPTIDRAAELLQEFNIRVTDGDSVESIERLGLSFKEMQDLLAQGKGDEALARITSALLSMEDQSLMSAEANAIFGAAMEDALDKPELVARLHELTGAQEDWSNTADDAVKKAEAMQSGFDKAGKAAESLGGVIGKQLDFELQKVFHDWDQLIGLIPRFTAESDSARQSASFTGNVIGGEFSDHALFARRRVDELADGVADLQGELDSFAGRFDEDQVFRRLEEDIERAIEATAGLTRESYSMAEGFDISTEAGRAAEAAMEDLSRNLDGLIELHSEGKISAEELADGQRQVQDAIREVARQMGLGDEATRKLINTYGSVPDEVYTSVVADTTQATGAIKSLMDQFGALRASASVPIPIGASASSGGASGGRTFAPSAPAPRPTAARTTTVPRNARAAGGITGGETLVGEYAPEILELPQGTMVRSGSDTQARLASLNTEAGGHTTIHMHVAGSILSERDVREIVFEALRRNGRN